MESSFRSSCSSVVSQTLSRNCGLVANRLRSFLHPPAVAPTAHPPTTPLPVLVRAPVVFQTTVGTDDLNRGDDSFLKHNGGF